MKTLFSVLGSIAGIIQSVLTFIVLLELKGMFFTLVCLFIFPVFALFPIWSYFIWGYSNPVLWVTTLTLIVGAVVNLVYKDE